MNNVDVNVLEEVGITELLAHSHHWDEPAGPGGYGEGFRFPEGIARLEQLGLVARTDRSSNGVSLTSAGVEALAYLAAA